MEGYLRQRYESWRDELKGCLAYTEAVIDFGDDDRESDIDDSTMYALIPRIQTLRDELDYYLRDGRRGEIVREGVRVALVGRPNAGKSSLLNALAKRPAAIVSPIAGTTRSPVYTCMKFSQ
jgi:tRNA modification GTPase